MEKPKIHITIFYCSQQGERTHQILKRLNGSVAKKIRTVPLPCSGKLEVLQLTQALESGADGVALFGCPEGACRYLVGSSRARGRVAYTGRILEEIGWGRDRVRRFVLGNPNPAETVQEVGEWVEKVRSLGPIDKPRPEEPEPQSSTSPQ